MAQPNYTVRLCDKDWTVLANLQYQNLQYSKGLNMTPQCYFEMQIQNPIFRQIDFSYDDNTYNIEITRNNVSVFKGEMDELAPSDTRSKVNDALLTMDRVGFYASHKIDHLKRIIANPDEDAVDYKRSFNDVSLGTAAQTLMTEAIGRNNSLVSDVTIGTIENPVDEAGDEIKLTSDQFLYAESIYNWIDLLAVLGNADYYIDDDNKFHFLKNKGQIRDNAIFRLHADETSGNNLTSLQINLAKNQMANRVIVLGEGEGVFKKLADQSDAAHQAKYGLKELVLPARVLATTESANQYAINKLKERKSSNKLVMFTTTQKHEPFSGFDLGDTVKVDVDWYIYKFVKQLRIVGLKTFVDQQNVETFAYETTEKKE